MARSPAHNNLAERPRLQVPLSVDPGEVPRTRRLLAKAFDSWQVPDAEVALLLVSELVTNALRYGRPPFELWAHLHDGCLRIEVHDGAGDVRPAPSGEPPNWDDVGGRGMIIVDALASRWGWGPSSGGKQVWFELDF